MSCRSRCFFEGRWLFLVPYLVLVRNAISLRGDVKEGSSFIVNLMSSPNCREAEGTLGLYLTYLLTYLRNVSNKEIEKKLLNTFNTIHEYAVKGEALPLNLKLMD